MPLDTVLCLDTSGSMAGRGMIELKTAVENFLKGVEETAKEFSLKENIAVVEFGNQARIVQPLTNNYGQVRRSVDTLKAGGRTPMLEGLVKAREEIVKNGGIVKIHGRNMTPRIILMTDGVPTNEDGETKEAKIEVITAAALFGSERKTAGLSFSIPIACVGCGTCDPELLEGIAKVTNGMFVIVENIDQLSTFFKRQVLLIRFAAKFGEDLENLCSLIVLQEFMKEVGETIEEAETEGLLKLLLTMLGIDGDTQDVDRELDDCPALGSRVRKGKDWKWKDQDRNGVGTITGHKSKGVVQVEWDSGNVNSYRNGAEGAFDLKVVDEPRISKDIKVGVWVKRGKDWKWGNQDGGAGNIGVVYKLLDSQGKLVKVRWSNKIKADYRYGKDGCYDLHILQKDEIPTNNLDKRSTHSRLPDSLNITMDDTKMDNKIPCWMWQDDQLQWHLYTDDISSQIEEVYLKNHGGTVSMRLGQNSYILDFNKMSQTNNETKKIRAIKRIGLTPDEYNEAVIMELSLKDK